jgi:ferric-dicitrate binding protein FerR (iron transport regulator)
MTDFVETLIRAGGRRVDPPEEAYRTVFAAAEVALREKINRRRWRHAAAWLAVAAAVGALAIGLSLTLWQPARPRVEVARVDRLNGQVEWREPGSHEWISLAGSAASLRSGGTLRTREGTGVGLLYPDGSSLRLAPGSEVELTEAWVVTLRGGTVYVASAVREAGRLEVITPRGLVRHVGTQFELSYEAPLLRMRVREGRVALSSGGRRVMAQAGEQLTIGVSGDVERRTLASDDPAWHWAESLAPMPQFDNRSARVLLEWAARETGRELVYGDPAIEQRTAGVILHGEPGPLAPEAALDIMLATTDLRAEIAEGGRIRVVAK